MPSKDKGGLLVGSPKKTTNLLFCGLWTEVDSLGSYLAPLFSLTSTSFLLSILVDIYHSQIH